MKIAAALAALSLAVSAAAGAAERPANFPAKPVRMVVPLAPGGGSDIVGRIVAQALTDHWGKPVVVDNRPGAGSAVGTSIAARAAPDGYTLLVSSSSIAITPALYKNLDFDVTCRTKARVLRRARCSPARHRCCSPTWRACCRTSPPAG